MERGNNLAKRGGGRGRPSRGRGRGGPSRGRGRGGPSRGRGRGGLSRGRGRGGPSRGRGTKRGGFRGGIQDKGNRGSGDNTNNDFQNNNGIHFSYKALEELIGKDDNEIIQFFMKYKDIIEVFENSYFTNDMTDLMTEILMKISKINSGPASNILYQILSNTSFNEIAKERLSNEDYFNKNYLKFLLNLILLNDKLIDKFTDDYIRIKYGEISEYVDIIKVNMDENKYCEYLNIVKDVIINMDKLKEKEKHKKLAQFEQKEKEREKNKINKDNSNFDNIPIDYKNRDIYLSTPDFNEKKDLRFAPHKKSGSYISYERYINTMFYLEYQDCYKDLKETINYLQLNKSINNMDKKELYQLSKEFSNIYFYLEGEIKGLDLDRDGAIITIEFRTHYKKMIKFTKRMITGSLVILTDNNFENYLLTTVHFNPYVDKKINDKSRAKMWLPKFPYYRIKLSLININQESIEFITKNRQHLQIFESKAYFESYIHVMKRLKELSIQDLPFKSELIDSDFNNLCMGYKNSNQYFLFNNGDNNMILYPYKGKYPKIFMSLFDKSQLLAIHKSLINRIALIQGPPGTGKTHVGTILTNILLQNMNDNAQILVVCFTNHALDSFIQDILKYTSNVVRIGGRCQNEIVAQYKLDNKMRYCSKMYKSIAKELDSLGEKMGNITSLVDSRRRVSIGDVKKYFPELFNKVIDNFFIIINEVVPNKIKKDLKYKYNKEEIHKDIYFFWNLIDNRNKNNNPDDIISKLIDSSNINELMEKKDIDELYFQILENFNGYDIDNLELLNKLNDTENIIKENNEKIDINNPNKQNEEEEEEEDDEEELAQNLERINYMDIDLEQNENNINLDEESNDENTEDLEKIKPLDEQKYNYLLKSGINFFKMGPKIIKFIINYMKSVLLAELKDYNKELNKFSYLLNKKKEILSMSDAEAIKKYKIVAMTTTGCAKYSTILEQSNFEVIIIEEAGEVLESHVLSLLTKNTKHLILIGDHKQLKPKPYNYEIETKYNFNVSMFERLINNNIPFSSLKYQRRMKPKFADYVRIIYGETEYQDYENVKQRPNVKGIENDMYFITHNKLEGENSGLKSKFNDYEAKYLVKLCKYLLQQGYKNNQITILTFYLGQVLRIKKFLREYLNETESKEIRVSSVDNYQGEECDIILLSLVRSNKENKIGFLKTFNRVCVAFSRAKIGLYIIGNINGIIEGEKIIKNKNKKNVDLKMQDVWERIESKAKESNIIGNKLTLICQNHKNKTIIENEKDFAKCPEGGCQNICKKRKLCGHACEKVCHIYDCNKIKCLKPCQRLNKNCTQLNKHKCTKICWEECGKCEIIVDKILSCGHIQRIKCCEKPAICEVIVDKILSCGHIQRIKCCEEPDPCEELVDKTLRCGHIQRIKCGEKPTKCEKLVNKVLRCGHIQRIKCYEEPKICEELVDKKLKCGHIQKNIRCWKKPKICEELVDKKLKCGHIQKNVKCCEEPDPCEELVDKLLLCGHIQKNVKCCEKPGPCEELVDKNLPCGHIKKNCYCYQKPKNIICHDKCKRKLKCGHPCKLECYQNCETQICLERIPYKIKLCNHNNNIECYLSSYPMKIICQEPCLKRLPCGHVCTGTCGKCLQGTLHITCNQKCLNRLICGHLCAQDCSSECFCKEKCEKICVHKKCDKNCYEICNNCEVKCTRECRHSFCKNKCDELCNIIPCNKRCEKKMKCGHQCYGLCGERCPEICEICTKQYKNIIFNANDVLFLYKTDCQHIFSLKEMDNIFKKNNIEIYKCPECNRRLLFEKRYKDKINSFFKDLQKIKKESYDKNLGIIDNTFDKKTQLIVQENLFTQFNSGIIKIFSISSDISYNKFFLDEKIPVIYNLISNFNNENIQKNASFYHLMSLAEKFMGIEYYAYLIQKNKSISSNDFDFLKNFNIVKDYFIPKTIQFNQYFFKKLKIKIDNMLHYSILKIKNKEEKDGLIEFFFGSNKINKIKTEDIAKSYFSLDLNLKDLYPKGSSLLNNKNIFKSLHSKWYKCPNEHLYISDETENGTNVYSCPHCTLGDKAFGWIKRIF